MWHNENNLKVTRINNFKAIFLFQEKESDYFLDVSASLFKCALKANWYFFS